MLRNNLPKSLYFEIFPVSYSSLTKRMQFDIYIVNRVFYLNSVREGKRRISLRPKLALYIHKAGERGRGLRRGWHV